MSEYFFGLGRGKVPTRVANKIDRIARQFGACFVTARIPGDGDRYWFAGPNRGSPFDSILSREVFDALRREGLATATTAVTAKSLLTFPIMVL